MKIDLKDLVKNLNLSEEQAALIPDVQSTFETVIQKEVEQEKTGVLNKNQELLDKLKQAKEKMVPDGFDMDGYQEYVSNKDKIAEEQRKIEEERLIATQNWDKLKNEMTNNHESSIKKITKDKSNEINSLRRALDSELIENVALKEIEKVNGSQVLLMPHIKSSINTYQDDNGQFKTKVVDQFGKDRINPETGNPMKVNELVAEFQANDQFAGAFPLQNKGSETIVSQNGVNYNSTNNPFDKASSNYSLTEQAKLNKSNPALAKTLKDAVS